MEEILRSCGYSDHEIIVYMNLNPSKMGDYLEELISNSEDQE